MAWRPPSLPAFSIKLRPAKAAGKVQASSVTYLAFLTLPVLYFLI